MILKYKLTGGQSSKYKTIVQSLREAKEGNYYEKLDSKMEMTMTQNVVKVHSNGTMEIKVSIDSSSLWKNGHQISISNKGKVFNMKMADNGEILESSGMGPQSPPSFPEKDINPGDTWISEKEISLPSQPKGAKLKTLYKFEGFEKFNGFDCAKIVINTEEVNFNFDEGVTQSIGGHGVTYFAYGEGKLIKSEVNTYTKTSLSEAEIKVTTQVIVNHLGQIEEKPAMQDFLFAL